ncbi:hypothetical protein EWM60_16345 [Candidatus Erwinia dacicola]|nr:hypothetical protein [Candidatus Erwinia dacicola]
MIYIHQHSLRERAKWDMNGNGRWQDTLIELQSLSTGFDYFTYGSVTVDAPRLTLNKAAS